MTSNESRESGFIGRRTELAVLTAALDDALAGRGQIVMLAGEPGISKTRLAQELASRAEASGAMVMWGWCYEEVGAPPYWPWAHPIGAYVQVTEAERLRSELGPGAAAVSEVIPELRDKLPGLQPYPPLEPEQARFRLFNSVTTFLKNAFQSQPILIVLDDLHWADRSSLLLLEFLAREIGASRLLVTGTYRDVEVTGDHQLSHSLGSLVREPHYQRVHIGGLIQQEVGEFVEASAGVSIPSAVAEAVHRRTEGNPLFVGEVARLLNPSESMEDHAWAETIPDGVRDPIGRRLSGLSPVCNRALRTASVIGRGFDFNLLKEVIDDIREDRPLEAIEEAQRIRLIDGVPGTVERYQFSHALVQQTLSEELTVSRRVRLHARIAQALENLYAGNSQDHAAELAYQYGQASGVNGPGKFIHYSRIAGEQDLGIYAHEEALGHFQRALAAKNISLTSAGPADDEESAALLFGLGKAQIGVLSRYQMHEAVANLARSFGYYVSVGDIQSAVSIAAFPIPTTLGHPTGKVDLIVKALELVPDNSLEAGRLLSGLGGLIGGEASDYDAAQDALDRALTIARREGDFELELGSLLASCQVDMFHTRTRAGLEKGLQAIEVAQRAGAESVEQIARLYAAGAASALGVQYEMYGHAYGPEFVGDPDKVVGRDGQVLVLWGLALAHYWEGDWRACREAGGRGLTLAPMDPQNLAVQALVEFQTGELYACEAYLDRLQDAVRLTEPGPTNSYAHLAMTVGAIAQFVDLGNRLDVAEEAAGVVISSPLALPVMSLRAQTGLAFIDVMRGDIAGSKQRYSDLLLHKGTLLGWMFCADRLLGLLAQTMGEPAASAGHFEDALEFCRKTRNRTELAWACHDYAGFLLRRNGPGDLRYAASLLDEGLAGSTELGMAPLTDRLTALQEQVAARPAKDSPYPGGLTKREVEVLLLVAAGRTDREIADDLIISVRTVTTHVSSILNKTGAANRAEAASYANQHGLVTTTSDAEGK